LYEVSEKIRMFVSNGKEVFTESKVTKIKEKPLWLQGRD
jgi:hypothetical protein